MIDVLRDIVNRLSEVKQSRLEQETLLSAAAPGLRSDAGRSRPLTMRRSIAAVR